MKMRVGSDADAEAAELARKALETAEDDRMRRQLRDVLQRGVAIGVLEEDDIKACTHRD